MGVTDIAAIVAALQVLGIDADEGDIDPQLDGWQASPASSIGLAALEARVGLRRVREGVSEVLAVARWVRLALLDRAQGQDARGANGRPDYGAIAAMLRASACAFEAASISERSGGSGPRAAAMLRLDEASRLADAGAALRYLLETGSDVTMDLIAAGGVLGLDVPTELGSLLPRGREQIAGAKP